MNKEIKSVLKKTAKVAGVTCVAAGAVAIMTSATALKAITEGGKYLADTIKRIAKEEPKAEPAAEDIIEEADILTAESDTGSEEVCSEE